MQARQQAIIERLVGVWRQSGTGMIPRRSSPFPTARRMPWLSIVSCSRTGVRLPQMACCVRACSRYLPAEASKWWLAGYHNVDVKPPVLIASVG